MKNLIFCLVVTMLFSVGVMGQKSVRSKPKKQLTPQQSWKTFFPKFKVAVADQDEATLKGMMPKTVFCDDINQFDEPAWRFCQSNASRKDDNRIESNLIFELLGKNNDDGWLQFKKLLNKGKELKDYSTYNNIALKKIALSNSDCGDLNLEFEYKNKKWFFTGFSASSCRN